MIAEYQLAEELGKFHYEIAEMPATEFDEWQLYYKWKSEQQKEAQRKAEKDAKKGKSGKGGNVIQRL